MVDTPTSANDNSPQRLTVESAVSQIESLISPDLTITPDKKPAVKPPAPKPVSTDDDQTELVASQDESETPDEVDDSLKDGDEADPENQQLEGDELEDVDEDAPKEPMHRVKVRGEEIEVTRKELEAGYSRQADYTRSKQELALEKAKFEKEEKLAVRESAKKYAEGIAQIEETLKAMQPQEPDWDKLAVDAPEEFATKRALWQLNQERMAAVVAESRRAAAEVQKNQAETHAQTIRAENELLLEMVPEWKDNKAATKEKAEIANYVKTLGFSEDDLKSIFKANQMVLLRNAYLYSKSMAKKPAIREKIEKVKAATPGSNDNSRPSERAQERRQQRLRKTGSYKDAAAVIENIPGLLD